MNPRKPRIVRPEDEDRRTEKPADRKTRNAGVESLPDGEQKAGEEAKKPRDD